jgi:hypothetical protein
MYAIINEIFGPKWDEVIGWRKLHDEELHNSYSSPSTTRMIKEDEMGRACSMHGGLWWESQKERDH